MTTTLLLLPLLAPPHALPPVFHRHDRTTAATLELGRRFGATVGVGPADSGTLIADRWVLTAAHVARAQSPFSPHVRVQGVEYPVVRRILHPRAFNDEEPLQVADLALLQLGRPVEGLAPVPLHREGDEVGASVFVVGFGDYGAAGGAIHAFDGSRRAVTNVVDRVEFGHLLIDLDRPEDGTELEGIGAPGDSGGSLYIENERGLSLAGVSFASVDDPPNGYGTRDLYIRVSDHLKWIEGTIEGVEQGPPPAPELIDVSGGFPEGPVAATLAAFVEAIAGGDEAAARFSAEHRSAGARRRAPTAAFVQRIAALRSEQGSLRPDLLAHVGGDEWALRVEGRGGWFALYFLVSEGPGGALLEDFDRRPERAPRPADPEDRAGD